MTKTLTIETAEGVDPRISTREVFGVVWLSSLEACDFLRVSRTTFYSWLKFGLFDIHLKRRYQNRRVFVAVDELADFLQKTSEKSGARRPRATHEATKSLANDANASQSQANDATAEANG